MGDVFVLRDPSSSYPPRSLPLLCWASQLQTEDLWHYSMGKGRARVVNIRRMVDARASVGLETQPARCKLEHSPPSAYLQLYVGSYRIGRASVPGQAGRRRRNCARTTYSMYFRAALWTELWSEVLTAKRATTPPPPLRRCPFAPAFPLSPDLHPACLGHHPLAACAGAAQWYQQPVPGM